MLNSLSSAFTLLIGILFYKRKGIRSQIAGVFLGFAGAAGLLYSGSLTFNYYGLFVVLATLMNGFFNNEVSKVERLRGLEITALSFFVVSLFALTLLLSTDIHAVILTPRHSLREILVHHLVRCELKTGWMWSSCPVFAVSSEAI